MNFEIIVKTNKNGKIKLICPHVPNCEAEGNDIDEAIESLSNKIAKKVSIEIKQNITKLLKQGLNKLPSSLPKDFSAALTSFPINLN